MSFCPSTKVSRLMNVARHILLVILDPSKGLLCTVTDRALTNQQVITILGSLGRTSASFWVIDLFPLETNVIAEMDNSSQCNSYSFPNPTKDRGGLACWPVKQAVFSIY